MSDTAALNGAALKPTLRQLDEACLTPVRSRFYDRGGFTELPHDPRRAMFVRMVDLRADLMIKTVNWCADAPSAAAFAEAPV